MTMMSDNHALISTFLQQQVIASLLIQEEGTERFTKAGIVPFVRVTPRQYYVMKPGSKIPSLGEPSFQLCKGTRMHYMPGVGWRDIRESQEAMPQKERLIETALREGIEELGLKLENIVRLLDVGPYGFSSATTGKSKAMWLFAAEIKAQQDFLPAHAIATSTADRAWVTLDRFNIVGRDDHRYILKDIESKLAMYYKE